MPEHVTFDHAFEKLGKVGRRIRRRRSWSAGAVACPVDAVGVAMNVTVVEPDAPGYVTVWPCGDDQPTASNLNYAGGQTGPQRRRHPGRRGRPGVRLHPRRRRSPRGRRQRFHAWHHDICAAGAGSPARHT